MCSLLFIPTATFFADLPPPHPVGITLASPVGPTAAVAELTPTQTFHTIIPPALFYSDTAKWTRRRVLVDPMEGKFVDFISNCSLFHPRKEWPAHESKDVAFAYGHATEGTGRTHVTTTG